MHVAPVDPNQPRATMADGPDPASAYASSDALRRRPPHPGGDISDPAVLQSALQARAYRGEIILFAFNFCAISDALALVATLRRASFEHFLPFTDGPSTCDAMVSLAAVGGGLRGRPRQPPPPPCYWSSWPGNHTGWQYWGTRPSCVSGDQGGRRPCVLEQLWLSRYQAAALLLGAGVNVLHVDTDMALLRDPYLALQAPPLSDYALIVLPEKPVNGGLWYGRATQRGHGAHWVMEEVVRRTVRVLELVPQRGRKGLPPFDQATSHDLPPPRQSRQDLTSSPSAQAMLGDVLHTGAEGGREVRSG